MDVNPDEVRDIRKELPAAARQAFEGFDAAYLLPLLFQSRCIGSVCFQAASADHFNDPSRLQLAREIACRASVVLHDYLVERRTAEKVQRAQIETFALILHNISTPISTAHYALSNLADRLQSLHVSDAAVGTKIKTIQEQIARISGIRAKFLELHKPYASRMKVMPVVR